LWPTQAADCEFKAIGEEIREFFKKALLGRNSLREICRIFKVTLTWLLEFIAWPGILWASQKN
jgi:hypothetical protein